MSSLQEIISHVRLQLGDQGTPFQAEVQGDGLSHRFEIPYELIDTNLTVTLTNPSVTLTPGTPPLAANQYYLEARDGAITLWTVLAVGRTMRVNGTYFNKYLTSDLEMFIEEAFALHTQGRNLTYETLPDIELHPFALLVTIEALWGEVAAASNEVDVTTPEGMHIPAGQRFQQILQAIQSLQDQYRTLSGALNIGLYRIEMRNLRRTSRTTGRLVPIYKAQEWDDRTPPVRVYPPIDPGA